MSMAICFLAGFALAIFIVFMLNLRAIAAARRRRRKEVAENPEKKLQTTKIIVFSIMLTYYIAFTVGVWVVLAKDFYQLSVLLTFVGGVAAFAVAFYCWKSKAENLEKIRKNNPDLMGTLSDFSGMDSQ